MEKVVQCAWIRESQLKIPEIKNTVIEMINTFDDK